MSSFENAMQEPYPSTRAGRRARQKRLAADRSRTYREKLKSEGLPTAREVDSAISEALAFVSRRTFIKEGRPLIDMGDIIAVAAIILKRTGKRKKPSLIAVRQRVAHRDEHSQPEWVPSTCPKQAALLFPPDGDREWTEDDVREMTTAMSRYQPGTPSQPQSKDTPVTPSYAVTDR